jgi:uncharacterized protein YbaR (Trm112 family)
MRRSLVFARSTQNFFPKLSHFGFTTNHIKRNFFSLFKKKIDVSKKPPAPPFDETLLQHLVCPLSKKPLRYDPKFQELVNDEMGIAYPIRDGIPILIAQEARLLRDPK